MRFFFYSKVFLAYLLGFVVAPLWVFFFLVSGYLDRDRKTYGNVLKTCCETEATTWDEVLVKPHAPCPGMKMNTVIYGSLSPQRGVTISTGGR